MDKLIEILNKLDAKYHFSDDEVKEVNEALYGDGQDDDEMYGDEYAEEYEAEDEGTVEY